MRGKIVSSTALPVNWTEIDKWITRGDLREEYVKSIIYFHEWWGGGARE